jgi:hypothetical protein
MSSCRSSPCKDRAHRNIRRARFALNAADRSKRSARLGFEPRTSIDPACATRFAPRRAKYPRCAVHFRSERIELFGPRDPQQRACFEARWSTLLAVRGSRLAPGSSLVVRQAQPVAGKASVTGGPPQPPSPESPSLGLVAACTRAVRAAICGSAAGNARCRGAACRRGRGCGSATFTGPACALVRASTRGRYCRGDRAHHPRGELVRGSGPPRPRRRGRTLVRGTHLRRRAPAEGLVR